MHARGSFPVKSGEKRSTKKILIAGAGGFIAGRLIPMLSGWEVWATYNRSVPGLKLDNVHWVQWRLPDGEPDDDLPADFEIIINLSQSNDFRLFPGAAQDIVAVNVNGTLRLLDFGLKCKVRAFIQASSGAVYSPSDMPVSEQTFPSPVSFYGATKRCAELLAEKYRKFFRVEIVRPFFVYGEGQFDRLMPNLLGKVLRGEPITVTGERGVLLTPVYVTDAAAAIRRLVDLDCNSVFNISGDQVVSILDIVHCFEKITGKKADLERKPSDVCNSLVGDNSRMKAVLGIRPSVSLMEGLTLLTRTAEYLPFSAGG